MIKAISGASAKAQRKRADILETALPMFAERGYEGTSIRDLARELAINEASIYYYFSSKDALYAAVIEEHFFRLDMSVIPGNSDIEIWLQDLAIRYLEALSANRLVTSIVLAEVFKPQTLQHAIVAEFQKDIVDRRNELAKRIGNDGRRDADWFSHRFFAGLFGEWALDTNFGDRPWTAAYLEGFVQRFVRELLDALDAR